MKYLTTSQAATRLGVSRRRVAVFVKTGRLKATHLGKAWMINSRDLEAFAAVPRPQGGAGIKALAS